MSGNFYSKYPVESGSAGVSSLNSLTGDLTLIAGTNITLTPGAGSITIDATGGGSSVLANNTFFQSDNAATTGFVDLIKANTSDEVVIGLAASNAGMHFNATGQMTLRVVGAPNLVDFVANILEVDSDGTVGATIKLLTQDENAYIGFKAPATGSADKIFVLPNDYGSNGDALTTDGFGVLSWQAAGGGGANTALSNLASTAINANLIFNTGATAIIQTKNDAAADTKELFISSGVATGHISGALYLTSGESDTSVGDTTLATGNNTVSGGSGSLNVITGDTTAGNSGGMFVSSGVAGNGSGPANSGDIFISSGNVGADGSSKAGDLYLATGGGTNGNGTTYGRLILLTTLQSQVISGAITTTTNANAGAGAVSSVSVASETAGAVSLTTGAGSSAGAQLTVNFTTPFPTAPRCLLMPTNSAAANLLGTFAGVYVTSTTSAMTINFVGAPAPATFTWNYFCIEVV